MLTEEFTGSFVTVMLRLSDGTEMKVQKQQSELDALDLGPERPSSQVGPPMWAMSFQGRSTDMSILIKGAQDHHDGTGAGRAPNQR